MWELSGNDEQCWCSNREALQALGFPKEEAEKLLRRAFGWTTQKWWRGTKVREVPAPGQVRAAEFRPLTEETPLLFTRRQWASPSQALAELGHVCGCLFSSFTPPRLLVRVGLFML